MKYKKSIEVGTFTLLIIALMSALVIGSAMLILLTKGKATTDIEKCRISAIAAHKARELSLKQLNPGLDCPVSQIKISSKSPDKFKRQEEAKYAIANEMKDCWYKTAADIHVQPFPSSLIELSSQKWCLVCSDISFENKADGVIQDFSRFLSTTKIPNNKATYFEYFAGVENIDKSKIKIPDMPEEINPTKDYLVIYTVTRTGLWEKTVAAGATAATAAGITIGLILALVPEPVFSKAGAIAIFTIVGTGTVVGGALTYTAYSLGQKFEDTSYAVTLIPKDDISALKCDYLHQQYKK